MSTQLSSLDLYNLIHTLTGAEKKVFKAHCNMVDRRKSHMYLQMFQIYDTATTYDKGAINKRVIQLKTAHPNVLRHNLYKVIMRSMRSVDNKTLVEANVHQLLHNAEYLFHKGLLGQSYKHLVKAKQLAEKMHFLHLLPSIYFKQSELYNKFIHPSIYYSSWHQDFQKHYKQLQEVMELRTLALQLYEIYKTYGWTHVYQHQAEINQLMSNPVLQIDDNLLSPYAIVQKCYIHAIYFQFMWQQEKAYEAIQKAYPYAKKLKTSFESLYLVFLQLHFTTATDYSKFKEGAEVLKEFRNHKTNSIYIKNTLLVEYEILYMHWAINTAEKDNIALAISTIKEKIKYIGEQGMIVYGLFYLAYSNFLLNNYSDALISIEKFWTANKNEVRTDLIIPSKFLHMMIYYELKEYRYLESYAVTTQSYIKKQREALPFEKDLLRIFKNLNKSLSGQIREEVWQDLLTSYQKTIQNKAAKPYLWNINYEKWLKYKIETS